MKRFLIIFLIIAFVFAGITNAAVQEGDKEVSVFGLITSVDGTSSVTAGGALGYFLNDELELAITGMGMWMEDSDAYYIQGDVKYHFLSDQTVVPYIGAFGGGFFNEESVGIYGPIGGAKCFVSETTNVYTEYRYILATESDVEGIHLGVIGVSFLIR
jgi:hypothetical protein